MIQKENNKETKVFSRHEINRSIDENLNLSEMKYIYCNKNDLLKAKYEIDQDIQGFEISNFNFSNLTTKFIS